MSRAVFAVPKVGSVVFPRFPKDCHGYDAVFAVIDRLSKRPISIPCHKTITAKEMAKVVCCTRLGTVEKAHLAPDAVVSDRGGQVISDFWDEFCRILGIRLKLSTSNHPQTDDQTEIWNQYIYVRSPGSFFEFGSSKHHP